MKHLLSIILLLFAIPTITAHAQQQELTIKVTPAEADIMWKGLRELPVKDVEALMQKMRQQVVEQTTPKPKQQPIPSADTKEQPKKE